MEKTKKQGKKIKHSSTLLSVPLVFLGLILLGTIFLMLPVSTTPGNETTVLTALFTSTTSVCVTGQIVVDTCTHWTLFGKIVILALIQLGGLGIIAIVMYFLHFSQRDMSLADTLMLKDMFSLDDTKNLNYFFGNVFKITFTIEGLGAILYLPLFCPEFGALKGIWYSLFTSVSAFCNAGIFIADPDSLEKYNGSPLMLIVTMLMIILGGIGYIVFQDFQSLRGMTKRKKLKIGLRSLKVHTRLVLMLTTGLIFGGALIIFILEYSNPGTFGNMPLGKKILNSIFQSVTTRTAGFATVPQENLRESTTLVSDILMFIGGSPLGTAGGVKTVTIFIILKNVSSFLANKDEVTILKRRVPDGLIRKSIAIVTAQLSVVLIISLLLMAATEANMADAFYETFSAVSTVGLSRGLTDELNAAGQILIIIGMFLGRVGPITMLLFFKTGSSGKNDIHFADGKYIVG